MVELGFWDDIAAIYVTPGVAFEVWYMRTSGDGVVLPWAAQDESDEPGRA